MYQVKSKLKNELGSERKEEVKEEVKWDQMQMQELIWEKRNGNEGVGIRQEDEGIYY